MFRFFRQKSIPPCRDCVHCAIVTWKNLYGGNESEIRCKIKSNSIGDYCLSSFARGSRECRYKEGTPTVIKGREMGY